MKKVASLRYGVIFKKAFSQPDIFTAFAQDFLGITLQIDSVETEKSFAPIFGKMDSRFDLFAEDKINRIIVNIQHVRSSDHYDRFLHDHCVALLEQVANAKNYSSDLTVFTIVVLTSDDRHKVDMATIDFDPKDRKGNPLGEIKHCKKEDGGLIYPTAYIDVKRIAYIQKEKLANTLAVHLGTCMK